MIRRVGFWYLLGVLAILSLGLRLIGLDWDRGLYLHPDERFVVWVTTDLRWPASIGQYFNASTSPLNPYNTDHGSFVYGTFPSFLVKAIAGVFGKDSYGELYIVGRAVNAVFDTGTVVLTALLARRFFNDRAGLLAGLLLAFTPLFLQSAHFFTVDTIAVFFTVAAFACALRSWDRDSIGWMALAGVMIGLAGASKPNYLIALAFVALPALELVRLRGWRSLLPSLHEREYPAVAAGFAGGFLAFWTFRIAQPYAFSGPQWWNISLNRQWLDDLAFWRAVQTGLVDMKPSIQWIDRTPVVFILQNMVLWGMGIALGAIALVALIVACWRILRSPRWPSWWIIGIVGWCIGSIAVYGSGIAQNQRYLMHIYPFLIILAVGFLIELEQRLSRRWIAQLLTTGIVVYTIIFGLAFDSIYTRPITRIEASEWIYENIPPGAMISNEYWDDALPMPLPGHDRSAYIGMTLDLYGDESANNSKVTTLVGQLSQVDYIVLSSDRVIDSVVRQPERYPVAVRYYEMLLSGELGFEPVASFRQGPEILGLEWDDRTAEESLTVYEHPQVRIFRKTDQFSAQFIHDELDTAWGYGGVHYIPGDPLPHQMLMDDQAFTDQDSQGNWSDQVGAGWMQQHPLVCWWMVMQVVGLAAWPLTWRAFRKLPDMGWMLAKGIGLLGMSAITLALVSWRAFAFDRGTIVLALILLLAIGLAAERCVWDEFRHKIRRQWRAIATGELVFLGVFLIAALLRTQQSILPDHNLMQFTAAMRSVSLPPIDPWLSGGVLHTHWAGVLPWASLGRLLSLEPVVAYNLAIVGSLAMIAGVIWSLVFAISRSWMSAAGAMIVVLGSSFAFLAGLVPKAVASSTDVTILSTVLLVVLLVHALMTGPQQRWLRLLLIALLAGALSVSAGWGMIVAIVLVATGLAIGEWTKRSCTDAWWPIARRFVLELVGVVAVGIVIWYPAYSAFNATRRNLISPELWSLTELRDDLGMVVLLATMIVVGIGAASLLNGLLDEGVPGIIVAGIASASVVTMFFLAWRLDAAIILVMLISFLAVAAAWHWIDDVTLLWSMAMILLACGLLVAAQTRQFHPDPGGISSASQLIPIAWVLIVTAVAIAVAKLTRATRGFASIQLAAVSVVVTIAMLVPMFDHVRVKGWDNHSSLADPAIIAPEGELQASAWLQHNASGMPVLLTADGPNHGSVGTISAVTGFPTVLGSYQAERYMRPGWEGTVERRTADVTTIYTSLDNWTVVSPLIEQYGIRYIVIGSEERSRFGIGLDQSIAKAESAGNVEMVFEADDVRIYHVIQPASGMDD